LLFPVGIGIHFGVGITEPYKMMFWAGRYGLIRSKVLSPIRKYPFVLSAEILFDDYDGIYGCNFGIRIVFKDGGSLRIHNVNERGGGPNLSIYSIDNNNIRIANKSNDYRYTNELKVWSIVIGVQLESIMDIVRNYSTIRWYAKNAPNLGEHRTKDEIEKLSEGKNSSLVVHEINVAVADRLHAKNILSFILLDGQEYYLYCDTKIDKNAPEVEVSTN